MEARNLKPQVQSIKFAPVDHVVRSKASSQGSGPVAPVIGRIGPDVVPSCSLENRTLADHPWAMTTSRVENGRGRGFASAYEVGI